MHVLGQFDESGKFKDHDVISFCGFLDSQAGWHPFQIEWDALLRRHGISSLHMSGGTLNFTRKLSSKSPALGKETRIEVLSQFIRCIKKHLETGIAVAVDVNAFMSASNRHKRIIGVDPHYFAFTAAMADVFGFTKENPETKACIVCDDEEKYFVECYKLLARYKREEPGVRDKFIAMSAGDDREFPGLQAADLLAYITRNEASRLFLGVPYDFRELHAELDRSHKDYKLSFSPGTRFWSKDALEQYAEHTLENRRKDRRHRK